MKRPEIVQKISKAVKALAPDAINILYGSEARGEAREDSDIDLLILLPDSYDEKKFVKSKLSISGMLYELSLALNVEISPLILAPKVFYARKTPFTQNVISEGIVL